MSSFYKEPFDGSVVWVIVVGTIVALFISVIIVAISVKEIQQGQNLVTSKNTNKKLWGFNKIGSILISFLKARKERTNMTKRLIITVVLFLFIFVLFFLIGPIAKIYLFPNANIGIFYIFASSCILLISLMFLAFFCDGERFLNVTLDTAGNIFLYEVAMLLSIVGIVIITGSLKFVDIATLQEETWFIFMQPVGTIVFFLGGMSRILVFEKLQRATRVFSIKLMLIVIKYVYLLMLAFFMTFLFFGGWVAPFGLAPFVPPLVWFVAKFVLTIYLIMLIRNEMPQLKLMKRSLFSWQLLLPLAIINILITSIIFELHIR